jgi:hypothetical protein
LDILSVSLPLHFNSKQNPIKISSWGKLSSYYIYVLLILMGFCLLLKCKGRERMSNFYVLLILMGFYLLLKCKGSERMSIIYVLLILMGFCLLLKCKGRERMSNFYVLL